jgi:hypothetical protein
MMCDSGCIVGRFAVKTDRTAISRLRLDNEDLNLREKRCSLRRWLSRLETTESVCVNAEAMHTGIGGDDGEKEDGRGDRVMNEKEDTK